MCSGNPRIAWDEMVYSANWYNTADNKGGVNTVSNDGMNEWLCWNI